MRRVLCGILAFIICSISLVSYCQDNNLQKEQDDLKSKIQKSTDDLGNVKTELSDNMQKVQEIDEKIAASQDEVYKLEAQVNELQGYIDEVQEQLTDAEDRYNTQETALKERLVAMYEAGETKYLDVLLTSKSISEFLSNWYLVSQIAENDSGMLREMGERKDEINGIKQELDGAMEELGNAKKEQVKNQKILENTKKIRETYTAQLSVQEKEIQQQIDEYNQRFQEINQQILELAQDGIDTQYIGGELAWPVPGYTRITSKYGMRTHPITGVYKLHTGVDIGAPMGANFIAANDGVVVKAGYNAAYGNMVIINHGGGISTLYAHGSEILVQEGQYVTRNQNVLKVGSTGYSTGAHAHFEVRINGVVTDPMPYITNGLIPGNEQQNNTENANN